VLRTRRKGQFSFAGLRDGRNSPEVFRAIIDRDRARWTKVVKETGTKAD
jgi:hypothetical protein